MVTKTFQIHLSNMASHHHHLHLRNENGLGEGELWWGRQKQRVGG